MATSAAPKESSPQDPLTTGLDFLVTAVNDLADDVPTPRLKFGLANLFTGIEILLKVRLAREHWSLVFRNVNSANKEDQMTGDFVSVQFGEAIERLSSICTIQFNGEHKTALDLVRKERNKLLHIGYVVHPSHLHPVAAKTLDFMIAFISEELEPIGFTEDANALLEQIRARLVHIQRYVRERRLAITPILDASYASIVTCFLCLEDAMTIDAGKVKCEFCLLTADGEDAADSFAHNILGLSKYRIVTQGGEWPVYQCPECGQSSFVEGVDSETAHTTRWMCFSCGTEASDEEVWRCNRCNEPVITKDGSYAFCDVCSFA